MSFSINYDKHIDDDVSSENSDDDSTEINENSEMLEDLIEDFIWEIKAITFKQPYKIYYKKQTEQLNQHFCIHIYDKSTNYYNNMDLLNDKSRDNSLIIYLFPIWNLYIKDRISYWKIFIVRHNKILYRYSEKELKLYNILLNIDRF